MRNVIPAFCLIFGACAYGPKVEHVNGDRSANDDAHRVFYALPRTVLSVDVAVTVHTFTKGLLGQVSFDPKKCSWREASGPENPCYWRFRSGDSLVPRNRLQCPVSPGAINSVYVSITGDAVATSAPIPDANHVYAVVLKAPPFQRLKADMELAPHGAPTKLVASSSNAAADLAGLAFKGLAAGSGLFYAALADPGKPFIDMGALPPDERELEFKEIVRRLAEWETRRLSLLRQSNPSAPVLASIESEQGKLRRLVEGSLTTKETKVRLLFEPDDRSSVHESDRILVTDSIGGFAPCGEGNAITSVLVLRPDAASVEFVDKQRNQRRSGNGSEGFRYRVPIVASANLGICLNAKCPSEQSYEDWTVALKQPVSVAQWGPVRTLPRRLGFGSGAISAAFDPQSGAIKAVSGEAIAASRELIGAISAEAAKNTDLERMKQEQTELDLAVKICASRAQLGLPLPEYCPSQ